MNHRLFKVVYLKSESEVSILYDGEPIENIAVTEVGKEEKE